MDKEERLMEASCWERLTVEETGSCSDELAMLNKYVIQFSIGGQSCVPSLLFDLRQNYGRSNDCNYFKGTCVYTAVFSARDPVAGHC